VLAGEGLTVEEVKTACADHVRKQEAGMRSLMTRADNAFGGIAAADPYASAARQ
jgi:hypothetical protein